MKGQRMGAEGWGGGPNWEVSLATRTAGVKIKGLVTVVMCSGPLYLCTLFTFFAPAPFILSLFVFLPFSFFSHPLTSSSKCFSSSSSSSLSHDPIDVSLFLPGSHKHTSSWPSLWSCFHSLLQSCLVKQGTKTIRVGGFNPLKEQYRQEKSANSHFSKLCPTNTLQLKHKLSSNKWFNILPIS